MTRTLRSNLAFGLIVLTVFVLVTGLITPAQSVSAQQSTGAPGSPVLFIENEGQFPPSFRFQVQLSGSSLAIAGDGLWYSFIKETTNDQKEVSREGVNLKVSFEGANPEPVIESFDRLDTVVSYFHGSDPDNWQAEVPVWGGVRYRDLYPGIDLELTSQDGRLVQTLVTRTGAKLETVKMKVEGADSLALVNGSLLASTAAGEFSLPLLQVSSADLFKLPAASLTGTLVNAPFTDLDKSIIGTIAVDDEADLIYSTYIGGSVTEEGTGISVDASGNTYVTGYTATPFEGTNFPTTPGVWDSSLFNEEIFVAKINSTGGASFITFLGGQGSERGLAIDVDESSNVYVTGYSYGINGLQYPTTTGAFDETTDGEFHDVIVTKLNNTGTALIYSTFIGGDGAHDVGEGIEIDADGKAYITGTAESSTYPTTEGAYDRSQNGNLDGFVTVLNPAGTALEFSTFIGGSLRDAPSDLALDDSGAIFITGDTASSDFPATAGALDTTFGGSQDIFIAKVNAGGGSLGYATYLGGNSYSNGYGIAVDSSGCAYITGYTSVSQFPITSGAFDNAMDFNGDAYVIKLNAEGSAPVYSTFLGGADGWESGDAITLDVDGNAYISGHTTSSDFPTTYNAFDNSYNGEGGYYTGDAFFVKLNAAGSMLRYGTFLGGSSDEWWDKGIFNTIGTNGIAYVTGGTASTDFPTTLGTFDTSHNGNFDVFVTALDTTYSAIPAPTLSSPSDNATVDGTPTYTWETLSGATAYRFQYDNNSDFSSPVFTSGDVVSTSYKPATQAAGIYYWRVKARDAGKNWGDWSSSRKITVTVGTPVAPILVSPVGGAFTKDNTPALTWKSAKYGYKYQVQVNSSNTFPTTSMKLNKTLGIGVLTTNAPTLADGKYYWRVRAKNSLGVLGPWSAIRGFTVDTVKPPAPTLSSPANNAVLASMPYFKWLASTGGFYYAFQLATDIGFTDLVYYDNKIFDLQCLPPPLGSGDYYWRVRAVDKAGNQSIWSVVRKLTIE